MAKILWATKVGQPDWDEQLITQHEDQIEAAEKWAIANGFDRLRVAVIDDTPPDFVGTIVKAKPGKRGKK
jgi:hypothetical protein